MNIIQKLLLFSKSKKYRLFIYHNKVKLNKNKVMTSEQARRQRIKSTNEVNVLNPFRGKDGGWYYNDEDLGVYHEAFVLGSSEVIDRLVGEDTKSFKLTISKNPLPGYDAKIVKTTAPSQYQTQGEAMQGWYELEGTGFKHWLCGCVLDYFEGYPDNIYIKISNIQK